MKTERKEHFDLATLEAMRTWTPEASAIAIDARVRAIEKNQKSTFLEMGLLLREVEERQLWKFVPDRKGKSLTFTSFDKWLADAAPVSRSSGYAALKILRELPADAPLDELKSVPRCNLEVMHQLPAKKKKDPGIIKAAQTMSEKEFTEKIEKEVPEAHIEAKKRTIFHPEKSARKVIDAAIEAAMLIEGTKTREESLEAIAEFYLLSHQQRLEAEMKAKAASV